MRALGRALALAAVLGASARPASAQQGEIQLGVTTSYATPRAFGPGGGAVAGVVLGRLVYTGVRWVYQRGSTESVASGTGPVEVSTRAQLFMLDLGAMLPAGAVEIVPGFSLGVARFVQRGTGTTRATEFVAAPGLAVHAYLGGLVLIPELQYALAGNPDFAVPVDHRGTVVSLRVVIPIEVGRIRQ